MCHFEFSVHFNVNEFNTQLFYKIDLFNYRCSFGMHSTGFPRFTLILRSVRDNQNRNMSVECIPSQHLIYFHFTLSILNNNLLLKKLKKKNTVSN